MLRTECATSTILSRVKGKGPNNNASLIIIMYFASVKSERLSLLTTIMKSLWGRQNAVTVRDDLVPSLAHPPKETTAGVLRCQQIE